MTAAAAAAPLDFAALEARLTNPRILGYPGATDIDLTAILPLLGHLAINIGDPDHDGRDTRNCNPEERDVCGQMIRLFGGDPADWFSYIGSGTTSTIRHAIMVARDTLGRGSWRRGPVIYASTVAHPCIEKIARNLRMPLETIRSRHGQMDLDDLAAMVRPGRPAVLFGTTGSTGVEGIDDVTTARAILRDMGAPRVWVHSDAAHSGVQLALDANPPAGVRLDSGVIDSVEVSGHKFLGTRWPSAWVAIRRGTVQGPVLEYTGDPDVTPEGCRPGHNALLWWYILSTVGVDGLRARAAYSRQLAHTVGEKLQAGGVGARWYPWAATVAFPCPPQHLVERWGLATFATPQTPWKRIAHLICTPGVDEDSVWRCVDDLIAAVGARP